MNYLSIENISKSFGAKTILEDISFGINQGQKVAFIAKNGTGKTTLINIITKKDSADSGQVVYRKDITIGYLEQSPDLDPEATVEDVIYNSNNRVMQTIKHYNHVMSNPDLVDEMQDAIDAMDNENAWDFEVFVQQTMSKLKIKNLTLPMKKLSGGQQKRVALAQVMMMKPDLLIMDEPTNHLDLGMVEWLEEFLIKEKITIFMVTHDRYFLDRVCNEIIELDNSVLYKYSGNYSYYLEKKAQREEIAKSETGKAKNLMTKELDWIRRQPKARGTKSKARVDAFQELKQKASKRFDERALSLQINMERLGSKIIELHKVSKGYENLKILDKFEYTFKKAERIGIVGENGVGKSTFLDILTGDKEVDEGKVIVGDTIKFGFYKQDGMKFKPGAKVIDVVKDIAEYIPMAKGQKITAAQLLEKFLFERKQQYDFIEKLSGGERRRLYMCTILMHNPNFLILDEPTNDLDILTLNVLEDFLQDYPGVLLVVSHDRYFMDKIIDHLFVFEGDGIIRDFPGNYSDYREYSKLEKQEKSAIEKEKSSKGKKDTDRKVKLSYSESKEFKNLENDIKKLEANKAKISLKFETENLDSEKIQALTVEISEIDKKIENKEERWMELSMKMEG
ncbi:MAG: ABC-F family ATP-binding cassette domain-containing protein [Ichthyobacteriaceae bacterium]|nr:ABC-F family ATP-binding cassette domain-containing protein [Ichthyobacteriaceae bacterium]